MLKSIPSGSVLMKLLFWFFPKVSVFLEVIWAKPSPVPPPETVVSTVFSCFR